MTTLFISDLHLDENRPDITKAFFTFIDQKAANAEKLYILGDLFEVWIGDDYDSDFNQSVVNKLKKLSDQGTQIFIMHGNRDFLIAQQFCQQTGSELINDPCTIDIRGQSVLLMHGDLLCTADTEYMNARTFLRSEAFINEVINKPIEERLVMADGLRQASKDANSGKEMAIMDVTQDEVVKYMQDHKVNTMIHGHTHRPRIHTFKIGKDLSQRIVLGDWEDKVWYLEINHKGFNYRNFDLNKPVFEA